jgi:hypothetical protein
MAGKKPSTKQKPTPATLPALEENSQERKRVLNVLAQRRYRQRRKEHVRKLESEAKTSNHVSEPTEPPLANSNSSHEDIPFHDTPLDGSDVIDDATAAINYSDLAQSTTSAPGMVDSSINCAISVNHIAWDTSILLPSLSESLLSPPDSSPSTLDDEWLRAQVATQISVAQDVQPYPSPPVDQDLQYTFPDEIYLEMSELTLLRGCMAIARRLQLQDLVWSLTSLSPFSDASTTFADVSHLPINLQPTLLQLTMPHHPIIDILPWPVVRDRLIKILAQPLEARPPGASSPMALLEFVYDIEDGAEGIRISGDDPYCERNWEVGEKVFRTWWWMFDRDIISRSNELRKARGAPVLGGSIIGEVYC